MQKPLIKLCSAILSATMLLSSFTLFNTSATEVTETVEHTEANTTEFLEKFPTLSTGDLSLTKETPDDVKIISSAEDYYNIATANGADLKISASDISKLPASIDNSQSPYFPPIGDQGNLGSCVAWAQVYYQFTYAMNKEKNVASTAENAFSPKFAYNLVNNAFDCGATYYEVYDIMQQQGNVTLSAVPYDNDYLTWSPTEEVWQEAIKHQIKDYQKFEDIGLEDSQISSVNDEDLLPIKTALSNGEILTFSTYANSFNITEIEINASTPVNTEYFNEKIITHLTGSDGGHRMTIVGYNDDIWVDINDNHIVDQGEMGAFKVANSWDVSYANDGFIWVAYDALNSDSYITKEEENRVPIFQEVIRIDVMPYNYSGDFYLKVTLNTTARYNSQVYFTSERNGTVKECRGFVPIDRFYTQDISYDGTTNAVDGTFLFPLKNSAPDLTSENFEEYSWSVRFYDDTTECSPTIIKNAEIVNAQAGKVYKPEGVFPLTINGEGKTFEYTKSPLNNIVVYYRGYDNPTLNYQVDNNGWNSASMEYNLERRGSTHKFVIPVTDNATAKLYFTDENGNIDNNNGNYYTATNGLNYYNTDSYREPLKATLCREDIEYDVFDFPINTGKASGGYGPYLYQFVYTNLDTNSVEEFIWTDTPDSSFTSFRFRTEGNYRITLNVKDYSDTIASDSIDLYIKDVPFIFDEFELLQGDKVVAGQPVTIYAKTIHEQMMAWGDTFSIYKITVAKNGVTYYETEKLSDYFSFTDRISTITENWTPYETGTYTVTISSIDANEDYAEGSFTFEVKDHKIGDVDCNTEINIRDATLLQMYIAHYASESEINFTASDVNKDSSISISDATNIQMSVANLDSSSYVGDIIPIDIPPLPTTEPTTAPETTQPTTEPITDPDTQNKVYFTNVHKWDGTMYCYYWSDSNTNMTSWPGEPMVKSDEYTVGETVYTFNVPEDATYIIFTNGSTQTVDIPYSGGTMKYYPYAITDSKGHYEVGTW